MNHIENAEPRTNRAARRFKPVRLLIAAAAVAALSVSALAAGRFFKAGEPFQDFFTPEDGALSQNQVDVIDRLGQVFDGEVGPAPAAVASNGATITPIAAIADENVYYLRLRVEAPEGTALPDPDREVFLRHYYYAQTVQEIAHCMDLNLSTVKTKLRRGRTRLKEILTREGFTSEA